MYSVDTSSLIFAWSEHYPIAHFPRFWNAMDQLIADKRIFAPDEVLNECSKRDEDLHNWLKDREQMFVPLEEPIQIRHSEILAKFPQLVDARKTHFAADPWVIALALEHGLTIVTEERPTGSAQRPNIPDVCNDEQFTIPCINMLALIKTEKWVLG